MDQPESEGVRLLSFDRGTIQAISQLIILDEFMRRIEWDSNSNNRIRPCDYFHMIAGVGTGGIIATLLSVLCMGIEEATEEFIAIWQSVYADDTYDRATRSAKLETVISGLLKRKGIAENQSLRTNFTDDRGCKAFVCAVPETNMGLCEKFRTYGSRETSINPTVVEALRATCAVPALFTPVTIGSTASQANYITGTYNFNNPTWEMIKEACEHFGTRRPIACVLSIGCGRRAISNVEANPGFMSNSLIEAIASDCQPIDRDLSWRIGKSDVYCRLSVDGGSSRNSVEEIVSCTKNHLGQPRVIERVDQGVTYAQRLGRKTLGDIAGVNEERSASAHGLPSLSAFFVERPQLIKKMANCLFRIGPPAQRRMVLSGLGGIGKTQITISFLLQFLPRFRHVLFIDASSIQSIERGIIAKVKSLGPTYSCTTASDALEVLANPDHEITRDWAIIYDNVDDPSIPIAQYFPQCDFGTIVITTRNPNLGLLAPNAHVPLEIMTEDEAAEVLLRSSIQPTRAPTDAEHKHARAIAEALGYLPVALVQAGYFIKLHDCMPDYLRRLLKRRPQILNRPAAAQLDKHYHGIYAALDVTWPHISERARDFLGILAFVNYTGFPLVLIHRAVRQQFLFEPFNFLDRPAHFQEAVQLLCDTFRPSEDWDEQDVDDLVAELEQYSLVSRMTTFTVTTFRLHPLVHSWIYDRLSQSERELHRAATVRLLMCGTGDNNRDIFEFIHPHISSLCDGMDNLHVNDRAALATIFSDHFDFLTPALLWESVLREVAAVYGEDDLRTSEAKFHLSRCYRNTNSDMGERYLLASGMEREVVECRSRILGSEHPMTLKAILRQARGMAWHGIKGQPVSLVRGVLELWQMRQGNNWESIIEVKEALAVTLTEEWGLEELKEAVQLRREVLQTRKERNGPDHHATLDATERLAEACDTCASKSDAYYETGVGGEPSSIDIWLTVVDAKTSRRGIRHPDTLAAMERLGDAYSLQGMNSKAIECWEEVVALRKEIQPTHENTLWAIQSLACKYQSGDIDKCVELWKELIDLRKEIQGPQHHDTYIAMRQLAETYTCHAQFETSGEASLAWWKEAGLQWKELAMLDKERHGPGSESTIATIKRAEKIYLNCGGYNETEVWEMITALRSEVQGPNHENTLDAMQTLAHIRSKSKPLEEVDAEWKALIALRKEVQGPTHPNILRARRELEGIYWDFMGEGYEMERGERRLSLVQEVHGNYHEETFKVMRHLAIIAFGCGRHKDGETRMKQLIAMRKEVDGPRHQKTLSAMEFLARLHYDCKQYEEAVSQLKEVIALRREADGPDHESEETVSAMRKLDTWCRVRSGRTVDPSC